MPGYCGLELMLEDRKSISLKLGKHNFMIIASKLMPYQLPISWEKFCDYNNEEDDTIVIYLDDNLDNYDALTDEMWISEIVDGEIIASCNFNRHPMFSIRYRNNCPIYYVSAKNTSNAALGIQYAIMIALRRNCIGLHCVTVICGNQGIALSAPSGTGKSTLARLLAKYGDAAIINGDFALISVDEKGTVMFEPTPFCGSSGISYNVRIPLNQIVFLEQSENNYMKKLDTNTALGHMLHNTFIPTWDSSSVNSIIQNIASIMEHVTVKQFGFFPTVDAVTYFYKELNEQ